MARQDPSKIEGQVPHAPGTKEPLQWHRLGLDKLEATLKERPWVLVASEQPQPTKVANSSLGCMNRSMAIQ